MKLSVFFQSLATKHRNPKFNFEVDVDVGNGLKNGSFKVRRHPGSCAISPVSLPGPLIQAVEAVVSGMYQG